MLDVLRCALLECGIDHDDAEWMSEKIKRRIEAPNNANERVYAKALETWGKRAQIAMVFEEMAELQKELCKNLRGEKNCLEIAEEIADVEIMLEQMKMLYGVTAWVNEAKQIKIERLRKRLEDVLLDRVTELEKENVSLRVALEYPEWEECGCVNEERA